jgi:hypothetical protein
MVEQRENLAMIHPEGPDKIVVFGDIHGDLQSFHAGLEYWGENDVLVLLGDYADRGPEGVEVIEEVHELLEAYPQRVIALKGNHEDYTDDGRPKFAPCTLIGEAENKKGSWPAFFTTFSSFLSRLYMSAILPGSVLFVHGGIGSSMRSLDDLVMPGPETINTMLWSDPGETQGERPNFRGAGTVFGPDVTETVLSNLQVELFVRSHEPRKARNGPAIEHDGRVITTSTTTIYGGKPFILTLEQEQFPSTPEELREATVFL